MVVHGRYADLFFVLKCGTGTVGGWASAEPRADQPNMPPPPPLHSGPATPCPAAFLPQEVEVLQSLGQDASIIQLHGACVQGSTVLLIFDFMEVG